MNWRLLKDGAQSGARNMAIDEALLLHHAREVNSAPALRFYAWQPACLSLGRFQRVADVPSLAREYSHASLEESDHPATSVAGQPVQSAFDWVRRPTGGRAVWHQDEITYCVVLREELLPCDSQSVVGAYEWLSRAFLGGLFQLGVDAELAPLAKPESASTRTGVMRENISSENAMRDGATNDDATRDANCFHSATRADFITNGRKLIGAAQMRRDGVVLQHGSILLSIDEVAWRQTTGGAMTNAIALRDLGVTAPREKIIDALCESFQSALNATLQETSLSNSEAELASTREVEKYRSAAWNEAAREPFSSGENVANAL